MRGFSPYAEVLGAFSPWLMIDHAPFPIWLVEKDDRTAAGFTKKRRRAVQKSFS